MVGHLVSQCNFFIKRITASFKHMVEACDEMQMDPKTNTKYNSTLSKPT